MRHGTGTLLGRQGGKYEGEWAGSLRHGVGKETWPNGERVGALSVVAQSSPRSLRRVAHVWECVCVSLSACLSLPVCLFVCARLSVCLSVCLSVSECLSV